MFRFVIFFFECLDDIIQTNDLLSETILFWFVLFIQSFTVFDLIHQRINLSLDLADLLRSHIILQQKTKKNQQNYFQTWKVNSPSPSQSNFLPFYITLCLFQFMQLAF